MANFFGQLRQASFRGIPFDVPDDEVGFGRRVITHEYPGSDKPFQEDLGAAPKDFTITAIVGGVTFLVISQLLENALNAPGPGTLMHPHYGSVQVVVMKVRRAHSFGMIGDVRFTIDCQLYGAPQFPSASLDTAAALLLASGNLAGALELEFGAHFASPPLADFLISDALTRSNSSISVLATDIANGNLTGALAISMPLLNSLTGGFAGIITGLFQQIGAAGAPVVTPIIGAAAAVSLTPANVTSLMQILSNYALTTVVDTETPTSANTTATRIANALALDNLFRGSAVAAMAQAAQYAGYDSKQQAVAIRSQMADSVSALRDQLGAAGWSNSWIAAGQVLSALSRDINDQIGRLPQTVQIRPGTVRPALALANRLYGDDPTVIFSHSDDIVSRNNVRNPCFVPASVLEVLIDAS